MFQVARLAPVTARLAPRAALPALCRAVQPVALPPVSLASTAALPERPDKWWSNTFLWKLLGPQNVFAEFKRSRWLMVIPAFCTHLAIGSPWAWSTMSGPLSRDFGFVAQTAADWTVYQTSLPMSFVFALQGISAAIAAKWQITAGARYSMALAGLCFGGGLTLGSMGVAMHSLPLLYFGYGFLGGCGVGIAYTPPVQALIQWFPDRKGLASGMCIAGFGGGALIFAPAVNTMMKMFAKSPEFLGQSIQTVTRDGKLFTEIAGELKEVVLASSADVAQLSQKLSEGYYLAGTGNTGAAAALGVMGVIYGSLMLGSAFAMRSPGPGYAPPGWVPPPPAAGALQAGKNVSLSQTMRTPQFYLLATTFWCVATGGMGMFSVAKPMMGEVFHSSLPALVTAGFAGSFLLMMSAGNLGGRLGWAWVSDKIGRRSTFHLFTLGSIPLYFAIPHLVGNVVNTHSALPMWAFVGCTVTAITMMGGTYAIMPAYEADLFGSKYVGPIHGRFLLASSAAALAGPNIILSLRSRSEKNALAGLLDQVDPSRFQATFGGTPISEASELIKAKTVTIAKLMDIAPAHVTDPTPFIYNSTMYVMVGFMATAAVAHSLVRPVAEKFFEKTEE